LVKVELINGSSRFLDILSHTVARFGDYSDAGGVFSTLDAIDFRPPNTPRCFHGSCRPAQSNCCLISLTDWISVISCLKPRV